MTGFCVWIYGLSGSGKTTLADRLAQALADRGLDVEVLDGGRVREQLEHPPGFSKADRLSHLERLAFEAGLLTRRGAAVIVAAVCPYQEARERARELAGRLVEVWLECPIETCREREDTDLYVRAAAGEIEGVSGLDAPFDRPERPDLMIKTGQEQAAESLGLLLNFLEMMRLAPPAGQGGYSDAEADLIQKRLSDLGYL